ncbi:Aminotransferase swnA [Fusarium oxysporum f. sp. albedinis]|nr:Aminotransferase swnA [Fusarium oxysporum f. sp. albedinis]
MAQGYVAFGILVRHTETSSCNTLLSPIIIVDIPSPLSHGIQFLPQDWSLFFFFFATNRSPQSYFALFLDSTLVHLLSSNRTPWPNGLATMYFVPRDTTAADSAATFSLYHYDPSIAAAVIMVLLFLGATIFHFWQLIRERCWFTIPLAIGGIRK